MVIDRVNTAARYVRRALRDAVRRTAPAWAPAAAALVLVLAYWNAADLTILRDHPLPPWVFWPAVWVLLTVAVMLLIPSYSRGGETFALVAGATGLVLLFVAGVSLAVSLLASDGDSRRGQLIDRGSSADGQYEVQVFQWQAAVGEEGWDIVVRRRDGVTAYAGCLFSENSGSYERIQSIQRVPANLCQDYG